MISFQIAGIVLILVILIFYLSQKRLTLKSGQLFLLAAVFVSVLQVIDILSIYFGEHSDIFDVTFIHFFCKIYLVLLIIVSSLGFTYMIRDAHKYNKKVRRLVFLGMTIITLLAAILIGITEIRVVYDGANVFYTEGPSCLICYGVCGLMLVLTIVAAIIYRGTIQRSKTKTIIAWMLIWIIAAGIQFFVKQLLIVSFASAIGLMIIYIMLENPALVIDKETSCFNSSVYKEYMRELFDSKKNFKIVYLVLHDNETMPVGVKKKALTNLADILSSYSNNKIFTTKNNYLAFRNEYGFIVVLKNVSINDFFQKFDASLIDYNKRYEKAYSIRYLLFDNTGIVKNYKEFRSLLKEVLDNNDIVTYKNNKYYIDNDTVKRIEDNIIMDGVIKNAIENDLVEVYYQPIYSKKENKITSAEALVRIRDSHGALIYPNSFVELAEKNGLIGQLGEMVFIHVCKFLSEFNIKYIGLEYIEINLSAIQCGNPNLALRYIEIMKEYKIDPKEINLEITETASTNLRNIMLDNMNKLISYGVNFSLDDFGMGNSNLNYIIEMPVEIVKFDRILVNSYFTDPKARLVITKIIEMIKSLNLEIVLEGIETKETLDEALKLDIDFIQGYYYSKPITKEEFVEYVSKFNTGVKE